MSWLVILRPTREGMAFEPTGEESRLVSDHYEYLVRLRAEGKLLVAGPSIVAGDTFGIGVLDVDGEDEVRAIVTADPLVGSGAMTAEIRPFRIAVR